MAFNYPIDDRQNATPSPSPAGGEMHDEPAPKAGDFPPQGIENPYAFQTEVVSGQGDTVDTETPTLNQHSQDDQETPVSPLPVAGPAPREKAGRSKPRDRAADVQRSGRRFHLTLGELSASLGNVTRTLRGFRMGLEEQVIAAHGGSISLAHAAAINTACRWERHAMLCHRWLSGEMDKLDVEKRAQLSRQIADASANRDKAIERLGLAATASSDIWAAIDRPAKES